MKADVNKLVIGFNSCMVQLKYPDGKQPGSKDLVLIPVWCN